MAAATEDKFKKFENEGITFKAKLIGGELVMEPRGDKMCQNSIQRLKAIIKGQKAHKRRILLKISYSGVKVCDEKTNEILYHHEVPQISFIASDDTDSRTFGYVCDVPNKAHQFICFKTSGPALQVMSEISSLFEAVLEKKKLKKLEQSASGSDDQSKEAECNKGEEENSKSRANLKEDDEAKQQFKKDHEEYFSKDFADLKDLQITAHETTRLDESPFDLFTGASGGGKSGRADSSGGGANGGGSIGAGGDSGIMDLTFNDWLSSPQQEVAAGGPPAPPQYQYQQSDEFGSQSNSSPFDSSPAIPIAKAQRSQQLNFTSSSFTGGQELSKTTPVPTMLHHRQMPISTPLTCPTPNATTAADWFPSAQNRSLIYNHSSVSLNDAALSHRLPAGQAVRHESTDKYAVFNDIDALPSIFESISSLDSTSKLSNAGQQLHPGSQSMDFRQHHQPSAAYRRQQFSTSVSNTTTAINAASTTTSRQPFQQSSPSSGMPPRQMSNPFDDDFFA